MARVDRPYKEGFPIGFFFIEENRLAQKISTVYNQMEVETTVVAVPQADEAQRPDVNVRMQEASSVTANDELGTIRSFLMWSGTSVAGVENVVDEEERMDNLSTTIPLSVFVGEPVVPLW